MDQCSPAPQHPRRILLVEDHADTRHFMIRLLERMDYEIHGADSLGAARTLTNQHRFDLIICDLDRTRPLAGPVPNGRDRYKRPATPLTGLAAETLSEPTASSTFADPPSRTLTVGMATKGTSP